MTGKGRESREEPGPESPIPEKLYFKIGEVAQLVGVQAHVLRYWEREIPLIRPGKSASNQRRYRHKDVEIFREIRRLLYEERYTLAGAKRRLMGGGDSGEHDHDGGERSKDAAEAEAGIEPTAAGEPEPEGADARAAALERSAAVSRAPDGPTVDKEAVARLRRELEDLVRLTGEEP